MVPCKEFYDALAKNGIDFFTGVPDSLLKDFCAYVTDNAPQEKNIIAANEGNAIALASGYHLATGKTGLVYMQNSGLGNAVNPLTSLADKDVYSVPMLLLIGLRGEPGVKDEPQHAKMGKITTDILDALQIPWRVLEDDYEKSVNDALENIKTNNSPYAIVVRRGTFGKYELKKNIMTDYSLGREEAIKSIILLLGKEDLIISTTGMASRELFEARESMGNWNYGDFLTVGSMGHSSSIALGIALERPDRNVYVFDGDGAMIMHMGALAVIGQLKPRNFRHIIFNNFAHDSVGGQPTAASNISIPEIAKANGYTCAFSAETVQEIRESIAMMKKMDGPVLLEIRLSKGARKDLGRPKTTPAQNKESFMNFLGNEGKK